MRNRQYEEEPYVVIERQENSLGSFLIGAAVGAGLALLFAPRTGAETRLGIQRQVRSAGRRVQDVAEDVTGQVRDSFEDARSRVEERIEAARSAVELKRTQVSRAMEAGRAAALEARTELERRIAETKAAYQAGATATQTSADDADL